MHAAETAVANDATLSVCFNLVSEYMHAGARQFGFMLRGLKEMAPQLEKHNIRFHLLQGDARANVPKLVKDLGAKLLVTDFSPARPARQWRDEVAKKVGCPFHEVDAHNVVPVCTTTLCACRPVAFCVRVAVHVCVAAGLRCRCTAARSACMQTHAANCCNTSTALAHTDALHASSNTRSSHVMLHQWLRGRMGTTGVGGIRQA